MNVFWHELKAHRKSAFTWIISISFLIIFFMSLYPAFSSEVETTRKLFEGFPEAIRKAFGIFLDTFFSKIGFFTYIFSYVTLCGAIQAMNLGTSIISKETRDKTADFLMTKPVSRKTIMTAKLLAVLFWILVTNIICVTAAVFMVSTVKAGEYDINVLLLLTTTLLFIQLIFSAIGVLVSLLAARIKSVLPVSLGTVFTFFIINMLDAVIGKDAIRYITPFRFFDAQYIMKNVAYEQPYIIETAVIVIISIAVSYVIYMKKNIHAV